MPSCWGCPAAAAWHRHSAGRCSPFFSCFAFCSPSLLPSAASALLSRAPVSPALVQQRPMVIAMECGTHGGAGQCWTCVRTVCASCTGHGPLGSAAVCVAYWRHCARLVVLVARLAPVERDLWDGGRLDGPPLV